MPYDASAQQLPSSTAVADDGRLRKNKAGQRLIFSFLLLGLPISRSAPPIGPALAAYVRRGQWRPRGAPCRSAYLRRLSIRRRPPRRANGASGQVGRRTFNDLGGPPGRLLSGRSFPSPQFLTVATTCLGSRDTPTFTRARLHAVGQHDTPGRIMGRVLPPCGRCRSRVVDLTRAVSSPPPRCAET